MSTAGTNATSAAAGTIAAAGLSVIGYGIVRSDLTRAVGGGCLTAISVMLLALVAIRRWVKDTQIERQQLAESRRAADAEHSRYLAAQAALEMERNRILRDAKFERERMETQLKAASAAMRERFEGERAKLICETFETAAKLIKAGVLNPPAEHTRGRVIDFPQQAVALEGQRVREH